MPSKGIIALDADGVLLDYGLAYAGAWQKAFGQYPRERDPLAYWPIDRWEVKRLADEPLETLRRCFDDDFWCSIPPVPDAIRACQLLRASGFELVCVTALPEQFRAARERNLRTHGFPIDLVHATDNTAHGDVSPKAETLHRLRPVAFVDDHLPYLIGIDGSIHRALIMRAANGSPNQGDALSFADSQHPDLLAFAQWWARR